MTTTSNPSPIGQLIGTERRRHAWQELVEQLHVLASEGGPLEGFAFHGTDRMAAEFIVRSGMRTTFSIAQKETDGAWFETRGTHWGTPKVAAFYAEDLIESRENPLLDLAIVAVRISDLEGCGAFAVDGQTVDCPLYSRLDREEAEVQAAWDASAQDWKACWEHFGTLLVLGPVPNDNLHLIRDMEDVQRLAADVAPAPRT